MSKKTRQNTTAKTHFLDWLSARLPIDRFKRYFTHYYLPSNLNFWYVFGSLSLFFVALQILTGIWLTMFYIPTSQEAFNSIETIMREVSYGWLLRYLHTTGASFFFIVIYCHIFRSLLYGSYKKPRELVWLIGVVLYIIFLVEAFLGYVLPWGQMSYWASQIATSLLASIPIIGHDLMLWVRGNLMASGETLHRFFALHVIGIPLLLLFFIWLHLVALRKVGSNNPEGQQPAYLASDTNTALPCMIPFHPYYTVKDLFALVIFLLIFFAVVFFLPEMGGYFLDTNNFIPADPLQTPGNMKPLWYLAPFYAMLCLSPNNLLGILAMFSAIAILFALPWLDRSAMNSLRYRRWYSRLALGIFILNFFLLGYCSMTVLTPTKIMFMRILAINYFLFFCLMPLYTRYDTCYEKKQLTS